MLTESAEDVKRAQASVAGRLLAGLSGPGRAALWLSGSGLLLATGAIHLDLYLTGYSSIPTIGGLFLLQIIAAFGLAAAVLLTRHWLAAAAGAIFAMATLGGYLLSVQAGLFGFQEVRTTAGIVAGVVDVAGFATLATFALLDHRWAGWSQRFSSWLAGRTAAAGAAAVSVLALALLGVAMAGAGAAAPTASGTLRTATIKGTTVLTNAKGMTLYWFAPDKPGISTCYGSCAAYWPPVTGKPSKSTGVTGTLTTISRQGGGTQLAYDGRPLYTYVGDSHPGQASGNDINLNGGLWHEATASGS